MSRPISWRRIATVALGLTAAPVVVYLALALVIGRQGVLQLVFGPLERSAVDFASFERDPRPNNYLVCPADFCAARSDAVSPVIDKPAAVLRDASLAVFKAMPRTTLLIADATEMQYDFEVRSFMIGFPDTVTIRFLPVDATHVKLAIYSRSHYGRGDFGVNEKRVRHWLTLLGADLSPQMTRRK